MFFGNDIFKRIEIQKKKTRKIYFSSLQIIHLFSKKFRNYCNSYKKQSEIEITFLKLHTLNLTLLFENVFDVIANLDSKDRDR